MTISKIKISSNNNRHHLDIASPRLRLGRKYSHRLAPHGNCILSARPPSTPRCENDAPAVVIQSISRVPKASLLMAGCAGMKSTCSTMNPLHITCSSRSVGTSLSIGGGHGRQCIMRDEDGDTPLHTACRCGAHGSTGSTVTSLQYRCLRTRGLTPVQRLWVRYFVIWARM
jgi:hypothetical protein